MRKAVSRYIAPVTAAFALAAGGGEAINSAIGVSLIPETATTLANTPFGAKACDAIPGTEADPNGETTITMTFGADQVRKGDRASTTLMRVVAGPNGGYIDREDNDTGMEYVAPGETLIDHVGYIATDAAVGRSNWDRNSVRKTVTKKIVAVYALDARIVFPNGINTNEEKMPAFSTDAGNLKCVPEPYTPPVVDESVSVTPTQPTGGSEIVVTPKLCPVPRPNHVHKISIRPKVVRNNQAIVRWSTSNIGTIDLFEPLPAITLPAGSYIKGEIPEGYVLEKGRVLRKESSLAGKDNEPNLFSPKEKELGKVIIGFHNRPSVLHTKATIKSVAFTTEFDENLQPCASSPAKASAPVTVYKKLKRRVDSPSVTG